MKRIPSVRLRFLPGVLLSVVLLLAAASFALAEAPMVKTQVPGYYRMMLGQFEVTALCDGAVDIDIQLLRNTSDAEVQELLTRMFISGPKMPTPVNAYLVNTGTSLILVDTGAGTKLGPTLGNLPRVLKTAGYDSDQIDAVLITHMHTDHLGGLVNAEGKPVFPKAVVYVAKPESDFWLSTAEAEKVSPHDREFFQVARDCAEPYVASGRWKTFGEEGVPFPGVKAVSIAGHTPGHTAYEITSGNASLLLIGDMVHAMALQFTRPTVAISFDRDTKQAIAARLALFKSASESKVLVGGMHIPFPGIGRIRADGENTYTWVPVQFSPVP